MVPKEREKMTLDEDIYIDQNSQHHGQDPESFILV